MPSAGPTGPVLNTDTTVFNSGWVSSTSLPTNQKRHLIIITYTNNMSLPLELILFSTGKLKGWQLETQEIIFEFHWKQYR